MYKIKFTAQSAKDYENIKKSNLLKRAANLLSIIEKEPFRPPYEKLTGNLKNAYSRRINLQHRLVYEVREQSKEVVVLRMWTHYE